MFRSLDLKQFLRLAATGFLPGENAQPPFWPIFLALLSSFLCLILGFAQYMNFAKELIDRQSEVASLFQSRIKIRLEAASSKVESVGDSVLASRKGLVASEGIYIISTLEDVIKDLPGLIGFSKRPMKSSVFTMQSFPEQQLGFKSTLRQSVERLDPAFDSESFNGLFPSADTGRTWLRVADVQHESAPKQLELLSALLLESDTPEKITRSAGIIRVLLPPSLFADAIELDRLDAGLHTHLAFSDSNGRVFYTQGLDDAQKPLSTLTKALGVIEEFPVMGGTFRVEVYPSEERLRQYYFSWGGLATLFCISIFVGTVVWIVLNSLVQKVVVSMIRAQKNNAEEMIGILSHEVRNPMYVLQAVTQEFSNILVGDRERKLLQMQSVALENALETLNNSLDLKKAQYKALDLECIAFDLGETIDELSSLFEVRAEQKGIRLTFSRHGYFPLHVQGDPFRLKQIMINLISNALKFTPEKGVVAVDVNVVPSGDDLVEVTIEVNDTGAGISADLIDQITKPYVQGDRSVARRYGGTGLGLHVVCRILSLMGSSLQIESRAGHGTQFSFRISFPVVSASQAGTRGSADSTVQDLNSFVHHQPLADRDIVYVDDNSLNLMIVEEVFTLAGACVRVFDRPIVALSYLDSCSSPPDMIICDICMPEMGGGEFSRHVKSINALESSLLVAVTALSEAQLAEIDHREFDLLVHKPLTIEKIVNYINKRTEAMLIPSK